MSLLFSKQCENALQAKTCVAMKPARSSTSIRELASAREIPYHFLAKILGDLTQKGLLFSLKGPTGGFGLAMQSKSITLLQVVDAIDGLDFVDKCVMGFTHCDNSTPCASHTHWKNLRQGIHAMLARRNLNQVAREMKKTEYAQDCFFLGNNQTKMSDIRTH